uniref:G-protein coupled receptors family 1 profile domain-containing protein n=1 Tax=Ciona savignyi TaxID=51511 RepID=H2YKB3_CIOSA
MRKEFHQNWAYRNYKLTAYLERLRLWECNEFEIECSRKTFAFTDFTKLVYERFCQPKVFNNRSLDLKGSTVNKTVLTEHISTPVLPDPYSQVVQYNPQRTYVELNSHFALFCGIIWCGFDATEYQRLQASIGSCLCPSGRIGTYIIMVICGVLAALIVFANTTVIVVFSRAENNRSTQVIYKMSMAVADLLVGLFVFPASIVTIYINLFGQRQLL